MSKAVYLWMISVNIFSMVTHSWSTFRFSILLGIFCYSVSVVTHVACSVVTPCSFFYFHSHAWGCDSESPCFSYDEGSNEINCKAPSTLCSMGDQAMGVLWCDDLGYSDTLFAFYLCVCSSCHPIATFSVQSDVYPREMRDLAGFNSVCTQGILLRPAYFAWWFLQPLTSTIDTMCLLVSETNFLGDSFMWYWCVGYSLAWA